MLKWLFILFNVDHILTTTAVGKMITCNIDIYKNKPLFLCTNFSRILPAFQPEEPWSKFSSCPPRKVPALWVAEDLSGWGLLYCKCAMIGQIQATTNCLQLSFTQKLSKCWSPLVLLLRLAVEISSKVYLCLKWSRDLWLLQTQDQFKMNHFLMRPQTTRNNRETGVVIASCVKTASQTKLSFVDPLSVKL